MRRRRVVAVRALERHRQLEANAEAVGGAPPPPGVRRAAPSATRARLPVAEALGAPVGLEPEIQRSSAVALSSSGCAAATSAGASCGDLPVSSARAYAHAAELAPSGLAPRRGARRRAAGRRPRRRRRRAGGRRAATARPCAACATAPRALPPPPPPTRAHPRRRRRCRWPPPAPPPAVPAPRRGSPRPRAPAVARGRRAPRGRYAAGRLEPREEPRRPVGGVGSTTPQQEVDHRVSAIRVEVAADEQRGRRAAAAALQPQRVAPAHRLVEDAAVCISRTHRRRKSVRVEDEDLTAALRRAEAQQLAGRQAGDRLRRLRVRGQQRRERRRRRIEAGA